jgi:hypothetical protein
MRNDRRNDLPKKDPGVRLTGFVVMGAVKVRTR